MKFIISLFTCIFLATTMVAQPIQLLVKRGLVQVDNIPVAINKLTTLTTDNKVTVEAQALALVRRGDEIKELRGAQSYTMSDITRLFAGEQQFTAAFMQVIMQQNYQLQKKSGVSMRGDDAWHYAPADSLLVISDSLQLSVGGATSILNTPISLYAVGGTDTLHLPAPNRHATIATPPAGVYTWQYTLQNSNLIGEFQNIFMVPTPEERSVYKEMLSTFQSSIASFSDPMQAQLLSEFLADKGWYIGAW